MDLEKFAKLDAEVLGVSGDSVQTHKRFSEKYEITFPMISDESEIIRNDYGFNRITYIIDKKGVIRFIQKGVPENSELLQELKKVNSTS